MKKLIAVIICAACTLAAAPAQQKVRIGSLEFAVSRVEDEDVTTVAPVAFVPGFRHGCFVGLGFAMPDNRDGYYSIIDGRSLGLDVGTMHRYQFARRFALGSSFGYAYHNYRLHDAASDSVFAGEVFGQEFQAGDISKQVYRSHGIAVEPFMRLYVIPSRVYADLGVRGDFAIGKFCRIESQSVGDRRYHDGYAFHSFHASAIARVGWGDVALFARYRLTGMFNSPKALPKDLPPLTIGIILW